MRMLLITAGFASLVQAGCITVSSARITAGDLSGAVPAFHALEPATLVGATPRPGMQRIFTRRQLIQFLQKTGAGDVLDGAIADICVERRVVPIAHSQMQEALLEALGVADAEIDLIDFSQQPLPPGALEFRRENLARPPDATADTAVLWRGRLRYDEQRSAVIWAKARISVVRTYFVAAESIAAGARIRAAEVRTLRGRQFPDWGTALSSPKAIIGKVARRNIPSGQRFLTGMLDDLPEVQRGEKVHVQVTEGLAHLSLDANAQSAGRKGDAILLHNPLSGRNFRAVITDRGEAVAEPQDPK